MIKNKVLVVGGAGYISFHMVNYLLSLGLKQLELLSYENMV